MRPKCTGFHVNFRALPVDRIKGGTTGFGGTGFHFRVYVTVLSARLGGMSSLARLRTIPTASRTGPDRYLTRPMLAGGCLDIGKISIALAK